MKPYLDMAFFKSVPSSTEQRALLLSIVSTAQINPGSDMTVRAGGESARVVFSTTPSSLNEIPIRPVASSMALDLMIRMKVLAPWVTFTPERNMPANNLRVFSKLGSVEIESSIPGVLVVQPIINEQPDQSSNEPGGDFRFDSGGEAQTESLAPRWFTAARVRVHSAVNRTLLGVAPDPAHADQMAELIKFSLERDGIFRNTEVVGAIDPDNPGTYLFAIRLPDSAGGQTLLVEGNQQRVRIL